jgi:hypothetical protein
LLSAIYKKTIAQYSKKRPIWKVTNFLTNFLTDLFWLIRQIFSTFLADFLGIVIEVNLIF